MESVAKEVFNKTIRNYSQESLIDVLFRIMILNFLLANAKGKKYQNSFCKRGMFSISQNLERKTDRLQNLMFPQDGEILDYDYMIKGEESFLDGLSDEGNYCNLALAFFRMKGDESIEIKKDFKKFIDKQIEFIVDNLDEKDNGLEFLMKKMKLMSDFYYQNKKDLEPSQTIKSISKDFLEIFIFRSYNENKN